MEESFKFIKLYGKHGEGKYAKVDAEDFERINQHRWWINQHGYAYANIKVGYRQYKNIQMHRFILNEKNQHIIIDHRNGEKLDNRKENLLKTDRSNNAMNVLQKKTNKLSKYRGVTYHKGQKKWYTQLKFRGHAYNLGSYSNEEDAAKAWNYWVERICGDNVILNDVDHSDFSPKPVRGLNSLTASRFKGVYKEKGKRNWRAQIQFGGKPIHIGYYKDEIDAAAAYNTKAIELFGNNAVLNEINNSFSHPDNLEPDILLSVYREFIRKVLQKSGMDVIVYDESNLDKVHKTLRNLEQFIDKKLS